MTEPLDARLGARVRIERESRDWSLTELAARSGVSRAMIHKVERGESSPTAALLARLSGAFGISMSILMVRAETGDSRLLRRADQQVWTDPVTGYVRRHVSPRSDTPLDLVEIDLPAGRAVVFPAEAYAERRHLIWVLDGELTMIEGPTRHVLSAGDCLELGAAADCVFSTEGGAACRYAVLVLHRP